MFIIAYLLYKLGKKISQKQNIPKYLYLIISMSIIIRFRLFILHFQFSCIQKLLYYLGFPIFWFWANLLMVFRSRISSRTKFDIYVFITVTVDISAGELSVSEGIIRQVVSGSVLTRWRLLQNQAVCTELVIYAFITINIHGDGWYTGLLIYISMHIYNL
jgi:hypothetical protein